VNIRRRRPTFAWVSGRLIPMIAKDEVSDRLRDATLVAPIRLIMTSEDTTTIHERQPDRVFPFRRVEPAATVVAFPGDNECRKQALWRIPPFWSEHVRKATPSAEGHLALVARQIAEYSQGIFSYEFGELLGDVGFQQSLPIPSGLSLRHRYHEGTLLRTSEYFH
jgi:hypothetical protein